MPHSTLHHADTDTVQDYVLTRSLMRFSRGATPEEWQFEHRTVRLACGAEWERGSAFLFDYTLGRIAVAAERQPVRHSRENPSFVDRFLVAIQAEDGDQARMIWTEHRAERMSSPDAATVALVSLLLAPPAAEHRTTLMTRLPAPYRA